MIRILFLDFDGVLNSVDWWKRRPALPEGVKTSELNRDDWACRNIDPLAVAQLSRIVDETNARIVVSSAWRTMFPLPVLNGFLARFGGFRHLLFGTTPDGWEDVDANAAGVIVGPRFAGTRGGEIGAWLAMLPSDLKREYAILDDELVSGHDGRLVQTDLNVGLTEERAEAAIEILMRGAP